MSSPRLRAIDLHPIVLCHITRFFAAARRVAERSSDEMTSMIGFMGNMVWAHSSSADLSDGNKRALAIAGGAASSLADRIDLGGGSTRVIQAFDSLEHDLLTSIDRLIEVLLRELNALDTDEIPASVIDAFVWRTLFQGYPWPCGQGELEDAIAARLR